MIKLVYCLRRHPDLSLEEFHQYWQETHGPLVRRHAEALGIKRYVQCHTFSGPMGEILQASRGAPASYDGMAELWFESTHALQTATTSDAGKKAGILLLKDEKRFLDLPASPIFLVHEHTVFP